MSQPVALQVAWNAPTLHDPATATYFVIDGAPAGWRIDRGRQFELDHTNTGTAGADINETSGEYDATNPFAAHAGKIGPLRLMRLVATHPTLSTQVPLYTGYTEEFEYTVDQSRAIQRLVVSANDLLEILANTEVVPLRASAWDSGASANQHVSTDDSFALYVAQHVDDRIRAALADAKVPAAVTNIFTGNVEVQAARYQPGTDIAQVIFDAADAEFPYVANVFVDKLGKLCFRGRLARFTPSSFYAADPLARTPSHPGFAWAVSDEPGVASPFTVDGWISEIVWSVDKTHIYNSVLSSPEGIRPQDVPGQLITDATSIAEYGVRSLKIDGLLLLATDDHKTANEGCQAFSQYYVDNYKTPQPRIKQLVFKSKPPTADWESHWTFLLGVELGDLLHVTTTNPGISGGFWHTDDGYTDFFVEGIHYQGSPATGEYDEITLTLDVSPSAYYASNPFE